MNWVDGEANLRFRAQFAFSIGSLYKAEPLIVETTLTTGTSEGQRFQSVGSVLVKGRGRLVGVASIPKTQDLFLNAFLQLPTEALAELAVELIPS